MTRERWLILATCVIVIYIVALCIWVLVDNERKS